MWSSPRRNAVFSVSNRPEYWPQSRIADEMDRFFMNKRTLAFCLAALIPLATPGQDRSKRAF